MAVLVISALVAACGVSASEHAARSSSPTTATEVPHATSSSVAPTAGIVLGPDGVGTVTVGESQARAIATMTGSLGAPLAIGDGGCHGRAEVHWGDLSLEFSGGTFAGYRYLNGPQTLLGATTSVPKPNTPLLRTATGATLTMTLAQVRPLYPASDFGMAHDGSIAVRGTIPGDRLLLSFFGTNPATPLWEIKGGAPCGDF